MTGGDYEHGWNDGLGRGSGARVAAVEAVAAAVEAVEAAVAAVAAVGGDVVVAGRETSGRPGWCHRRGVGWEEARPCLDARQGLVGGGRASDGRRQGLVRG